MSAWIAETLIATALMMALVLLARPIVRRAFGASAAYALWLIPALRVVMPPLDFAPSPVAVLAAPPVEIVFATVERAGNVGPWLLAIWAIGAVAFATWHVAAYRRFLARASSESAADMGRGIQVSYTDAVAGPAAIGLLRRRILLPVDFSARFEAVESALALRHERVHHARGDLWANAAALAMLSLHWFNPLAYRAYRAFREDQELSCDAAVIAGASREERAAYGTALVKSAQGLGWATPAAPSTICSMTRTHNLKRRLKMVRTHKKSALATAGGALAVGMTALAGLVMTATPGIAAQTAEPVIKSERIMIKRGTDAAAELGKVLGSKCAGMDQTEFKTSTVSNGKPVRLVLCSKDGPPTDRVAAMQKARDRLAASSSLPEADRLKALNALDEALAQARAR